MTYPAYSENQIEQRIDDLPVSVRDVKQAIAELARVMKDYIDKKSPHEAEAKLNAIIARAEK